MTLDGRTALITGGGRGLGRAMTLEAARRGAEIVLTYCENKEAAEETASELAAQGSSATILRFDLTEGGAVAQLLDDLRANHLEIDILVNNAGAILRPGGWNEQSDEDIVATMNMHIVGPIQLIRGLAPGMADRRYGRIVNITSTYGITGAAPVLAYTAAKAGLISVTYAMARELGSSGVTVNAVAPGNFDTAMTQAAGPDVRDWAISTTPLGRLGYPEEIGQALGYLLDTEFVTGHVLVVDGGQLLNM